MNDNNIPPVIAPPVVEQPVEWWYYESSWTITSIPRQSSDHWAWGTLIGLGLFFAGIVGYICYCAWF